MVRVVNHVVKIGVGVGLVLTEGDRGGGVGSDGGDWRLGY
jgi:hypothetical protein